MSTTRRQQHTWNEPAPPRLVERWEYRREPITNAADANLAALNDLGAEGWELVSVGAMHYWLKRRVA